MLRNLRRVAVLTALAAALLPVPVAAVTASHTWCSYRAGTVRLNLASDHVVRLLVVRGHIEFADLRDYTYHGRCGAATVWNTDRIRLTESVAGTSRLQFDQQIGQFGPGRTQEATGVSEIEVYLGTVRDVWLMGRPVRDAVVIGSWGLNINGDRDVDLIGALAEITAFLNDGDDLIRAGGGRGTGEPWVPPRGGYLSVYGDDGRDVIRGTAKRDRLDGEFGADMVYGFGGNDDVYGGIGNDVVDGGSGNDYVDPSYGADVAAGGSGDDFISAADYTVDRIDGGLGVDAAIVDREDRLSRIESVRVGP
jgi:hypothetical protein